MADLIGQMLALPIGGRRKRRAIKGIIREFGGYRKDYKFSARDSTYICRGISSAFTWTETLEYWKFWNRLDKAHKLRRVRLAAG